MHRFYKVNIDPSPTLSRFCKVKTGPTPTLSRFYKVKVDQSPGLDRFSQQNGLWRLLVGWLLARFLRKLRGGLQLFGQLGQDCFGCRDLGFEQVRFSWPLANTSGTAAKVMWTPL